MRLRHGTVATAVVFFTSFLSLSWYTAWHSGKEPLMRSSNRLVVEVVNRLVVEVVNRLVVEVVNRLGDSSTCWR
ncbi:hypothetical protein CRUP_029391 [Coryphaenoides rupestris]|nr:hypothetical protein CRUP_029391 [Coryphaenoides rupestris]